MFFRAGDGTTHSPLGIVECNLAAPVPEIPAVSPPATPTEAAADDVQLRYTVFQGSSVVPEGRDDGPGANHVCTWPVAYELEGVKEWLFAQRR